MNELAVRMKPSKAGGSQDNDKSKKVKKLNRDYQSVFYRMKGRSRN
jgi:hypothetical protein